MNKRGLRLWKTYFTPDDVAAEAIALVEARNVNDVVDICAGSGNLLRAASARWPSARLHGNDLYVPKPTVEGSRWSRQDGRKFSLQMAALGTSYDLVVANPPFGGGQRKLSSIHIRGVVDRQLAHLLAHPRISVSMTAASALITALGGTFISIVPMTLAYGETYATLREWLGMLFDKVSMVPLERGRFAGLDLGLAFLLCSSRRLSGRPPPGRRQRPPNPPLLGDIEVRRGIMCSAELGVRGRHPVIHCGGGNDRMGFSVRSAGSLPRSAPRLEKGDVFVVRVGRRAGEVYIFEGEHPTAFSDCILRIRHPRKRVQARIRSLVGTGDLAAALESRLHGTGAKFCTAKGVIHALADTLEFATGA
jgi:hypothetical protein